MAILIKVDGTIKDIVPSYKKGKKVMFTLEQIQKAVEGYFEIVYYDNGKDCMLLNEDGISLNLPFNDKASEELWLNSKAMVCQGVRGNVIVCKLTEV